MDPLRAGHVAILAGRFHYFCDRRCKEAYATNRAPASTLAPHELETQEPPPVLMIESGPRRMPQPTPPAPPAQETIEAVDPTPQSMRFPEPSEPSRLRPRLAITNEAEPTAAEIIVRESPAPPPPVEPVPVANDAPLTLRSQPLLEADEQPIAAPPSSRARARRTTPTREAWLRVLAIGGIALGALVPALGLLGAAADPARLPLAVAAALALVARALLVPRDPADAHPIVIVAPVLGAATAACWAQASGDVHALGITVFAGLAAAVALGVDLLIARAKAPLAEARERIARALDVRVRVMHGDQPVTLHADEVKPGETILVEAGEVVGVDAVVTGGEATVVPWIDAPIEITKREGEAVVAGARVVSGRLRAMTTWAGTDRAWAKLVLTRAQRVDVAAPAPRMARLAIERGAPIAAVLVAIAAFANGASPVACFAAACAAAFGVAATALASVLALHHARAHLAALGAGIVYKDSRAFDRAGSVDVTMLCARGTVLMGEPEIVTIESANGSSGGAAAAQVLALAAGAESASSHPFAAAILRAARARGVRADHVRSATSHAGLGVTALASSGDKLAVGSRALMLKEKISVAVADARINELEAQGRSVLLVALADKLVGMIALQDGLRAGARAAVQRLLDAKIEPVLLSGEARETCETIGRALDIDHLRPEVLPSDRGAEVAAVREGGHVVGVVGHPAGDDGALGAADVSVAMGSAGSTPGEWTISLASDDVRDAAAALTLPRALRDRTRVAIALGFAPGLLALLAVAFGLAPLAVAPLAALVGAVAAIVHATRE